MEDWQREIKHTTRRRRISIAAFLFTSAAVMAWFWAMSGDPTWIFPFLVAAVIFAFAWIVTWIMETVEVSGTQKTRELEELSRKRALR
jgi:hypothetical protein